ncbi:RHS repeat-associated core domain-containing protein [Pseudomonas sp. 10-1B]|uniref:RHS repeat-associated core domain-containing protein n=1 Tax=Pseudomonas sp. 10-1B TaxID=1546029 RepID=UPI0009E3C35B|nr:RHS repeat-associated core domain-containing protein [Pseudomonas sp. 10-1B]
MVPNASIQRAGFRINRFYCNGRISNELQGESDITVAQQGSQLLALQFRKAGARGSTLLAVDQQRSILSRVDQYQPQPPLAYTPYGHHSPASGYFGFNGERLDSITLHYLLGNGYRGFNPVLMRFNSPDNMSPFGRGGLNSYAYCQGDPINLQDPSGHFALGKFFSRIFRVLFGKSKAKAAPQGTQMPAVQSNTTELTTGINAAGFDSVSLPASPRGSLSEYDLIGYHGSVQKHAASLEAGVKSQTGGNDIYGSGFYFSQRKSVASGFAEQRSHSNQSPGHVFGVYAKDFNKWVKGVDFDYYADGIALKVNPVAFDKLVIRGRVEGKLVRRQSIVGR